MKKNRLFFYVFMVVWILLIFANFFASKLTFSEKENRTLAKLPTFYFETLVSGEYVEKLDTYINDHFVFRNQWLSVKSMLELIQGKRENNGVYIGKQGYLFEKERLDEKKAINTMQIANKIEEFASKQDIPVYSIIVPTSLYVNQDKLPYGASKYDQKQVIYQMERNMPSVVSINVVDTILAHKREYLYYKTDHHMTSRTAYLVYEQYAKMLELPLQREEKFQIQEVTNSFLGTFDSKAQMPNQEADTIYRYTNQNNTDLEGVWYDGKRSESLYNPEYLTKKDKYSYFLDGNHAVTVIKTKNHNGKKLLMLKDSYAHEMPPFLTAHYEEIHLVDLRYYRLPVTEYIEKNQITECLFFYHISNLLTDTSIKTMR